MTLGDWLTIALLALNLVLLLWILGRGSATDAIAPTLEQLAQQHLQGGERLERR